MNNILVKGHLHGSNQIVVSLNFKVEIRILWENFQTRLYNLFPIRVTI